MRQPQFTTETWAENAKRDELSRRLIEYIRYTSYLHGEMNIAGHRILALASQLTDTQTPGQDENVVNAAIQCKGKPTLLFDS